MCVCTLAHCEQAVRGQVGTPGRRMRRVRTGILAHYEQAVRPGLPTLAGPHGSEALRHVQTVMLSHRLNQESGIYYSPRQRTPFD